MGFDAHLSVDVGGEEPGWLDSLSANYTYNCSGMFLPDEEGEGLSALSGLPAGEAAVTIRRAIAAMEADPERYRAMNPANGWGDADGWRGFLATIAEACEAAPLATLVVH